VCYTDSIKTVVICGSRRFKAEVCAFREDLEREGVVVYWPYHHSGQDDWEKLPEDYQRFIALGLTHDHNYKIRMADVVYILGPTQMAHFFVIFVPQMLAVAIVRLAFSLLDASNCIHLRKSHIYNKNGYIGPSTTMELGAAVALGKPIYAYAHDTAELCRGALFRKVITSPEELVKRLL